jgi:hypothetical protein
VGWVAIAAGVGFLVVALTIATWVARSSAAFARTQAEVEPRVQAALADVQAAVMRLESAAAHGSQTAVVAQETAERLQRSAGRLRLLAQAGGEGFTGVRGLRRWVDPAG